MNKLKIKKVSHRKVGNINRYEIINSDKNFEYFIEGNSLNGYLIYEKTRIADGKHSTGFKFDGSRGLTKAKTRLIELYNKN